MLTACRCRANGYSCTDSNFKFSIRPHKFIVVFYPTTDTAMDAAPFFHELRKQASFFLKEKLWTARLALTDVTPAQLYSPHFFLLRLCFLRRVYFLGHGSMRFILFCRLTEEATNASSWAPNAKTMRCISRAAFEIDDYWRIVEILHKKSVFFF